MKYVYFGTDEFSIGVLDELVKAGFSPNLVVTMPDKPKGRGQVLTPPPLKVWAEKHNIDIIQPNKLDSEFISLLNTKRFSLFIVASYGKILPKELIYLPEHKTLNVHPSLLPKLRGSSPLQETILQDEKPGVTIMRLDEKMDHGPIVAQKEVLVKPWPISAPELETLLAHEGGKLLAEILPKWIAGEIKEVPQDENRATYTKKISKADGLIDFQDEPLKNFRKIQAFKGWPGTYFFVKKNNKDIRIIIKDVEFKNGELRLTRVLPEGKKEMSFEEFQRNYKFRNLGGSGAATSEVGE